MKKRGGDRFAAPLGLSMLECLLFRGRAAGREEAPATSRSVVVPVQA
jgi:hypothetical protein